MSPIIETVPAKINLALHVRHRRADGYHELETLFEAPDWPQKWLLRPMIERAGGPGSMPFGKGRVVNPFRQVSHAP